MKTIQQSVSFRGVTPAALFGIYLDATKHAQAVRAPASIEPREGAPFHVFGEDFVRGRNLAIEPGRMIVQTWRAQPWRDDDLDSIVTLTFVGTSDGARIDLVQANVPDHAYSIIDEGWRANYWDRWREYIESTKE